jgi:cold shock CspA family protein
MRGTIVRLLRAEGFAFVRGDDNSKDRFVYRTELAEGVSFEQLVEGMVVTFDHKDAPRGPRAINVKPVTAD